MSEHDAQTSTAPVQETAQQQNTTRAEAFSFGDPIPVLDRRELINEVELGSACSAESAHSCQHVLPVAPGCGAMRMHDRLHQNVDVWKLGNQTWSMPLMYLRIELIKV